MASETFRVRNFGGFFNRNHGFMVASSSLPGSLQGPAPTGSLELRLARAAGWPVGRRASGPGLAAWPAGWLALALASKHHGPPWPPRTGGVLGLPRISKDFARILDFIGFPLDLFKDFDSILI